MPSPRVSGARLEQLLQQAREPAFWLGADRKLLWVNRAWEELTGHAAESVAGLVCDPHGPTRPGDIPGVCGSFYPPDEALAGKPVAAKTLIIHASGERRWRRVEFWPFHSEKGDLSAILGFVREIDETPISPDSEAQRLRTELMEVRDRLHERCGLDGLIGHGPAHDRLLDQIAAAAASTVPVLVVGPTGTGKHLVGRAIHQQSARKLAPIVPLDCAALPPDVLERELFVSPEADGDGLAPRLFPAEGSTLLIGDVLDLPRDLQGRLASALDARVRLIAITTADPEEALRSERLRADLYYRLTAFVIRLAPLRERLDELPVLAQHLLERANLRGGRQRSGFTPAAIDVLLAYDWPGNLRELARVVEEAHSRGEHDAVDADDLPAAIRGHLASAYLPPPPADSAEPPASLDDLLTQVERRLIEMALGRARHNKSRAAELLGISRPRLYRRIKELNIPDEADNGDEAVLAPQARP